jgi:hypothetical protein
MVIVDKMVVTMRRMGSSLVFGMPSQEFLVCRREQGQ